ncbi:MAG: hypothetical protein ABIZ49_03065 [Opitutaceae bacterium]
MTGLLRYDTMRGLAPKTKGMRFPKALLPIFLAPWFAPGCAQPAKIVSFKFVDLKAGPAGAIDIGKYEIKRGETVFVDAKPIEPLKTPSYPTNSPKPHADSVTVVAKIVVGADGRVEEIQRSIADFSLPTPFSRDCFEAAKDAISQWRFEPAQIAVVQPQANGRPLIVSSTPTDRSFEIAFTFSSSGRVVSAFSKDKERQTR